MDSTVDRIGKDEHELLLVALSSCLEVGYIECSFGVDRWLSIDVRTMQGCLLRQSIVSRVAFSCRISADRMRGMGKGIESPVASLSGNLANMFAITQFKTFFIMQTIACVFLPSHPLIMTVMA